MPTIKAFQAIHPLTTNAADIVCTIEGMSLDAVKESRKNNSKSFIHLLFPEIITTINGEETKAYNKINQNLQDFLANQLLIKDAGPAIYIYRIFSKGIEYTGVWTTTSIDDYANGIIKKHEHTVPEREEHLVTYLTETGIDANPVLITYRSSAIVNKLILEVTNTKPEIYFKKDAETHQVWKIDSETHVNKFRQAFLDVRSAYIADGHHRASAALNYCLKQRSEASEWNGDEEFNYFSTVYISDDQLTLTSYNRLINGLSNLTANEFLDQLQENFVLFRSDKNLDLKKHQIGLYLEKVWYKIEIKPQLLSSLNLVETLPASILQNYILNPILNVKNPESDKRLHSVPGIHSYEVLEEHVDSGKASVAFVLNPVALEDFMQIAESGKMMPPKSTWFEPKFPVGLLIHQI